jgi:hypothetical protein
LLNIAIEVVDGFTNKVRSLPESLHCDRASLRPRLKEAITVPAGTAGSDRAVSRAEDLLHQSRLYLPVLCVLDDAQRIDPEKLYVEASGYAYSILKCFWERSFHNFFSELLDIGAFGLERLILRPWSPSMRKRNVFLVAYPILVALESNLWRVVGPDIKKTSWGKVDVIRIAGVGTVARPDPLLQDLDMRLLASSCKG